jgi:hypothetical protein
MLHALTDLLHICLYACDVMYDDNTGGYSVLLHTS